MQCIKTLVQAKPRFHMPSAQRRRRGAPQSLIGCIHNLHFRRSIINPNSFLDDERDI